MTQRESPPLNSVASETSIGRNKTGRRSDSRRRSPTLHVYGTKVGRDQFAHLRAIAEGVSVEVAALNYLAIDHVASAVTAHREVVERVRAVARRRGDSRWRLIGLNLDGSTLAGAPKLPTLAAWAEEKGIEDWAQVEQLALFAEAFPESEQPIEPSARRRMSRNARLRQRRLELLRELELLAADVATPSDLLEGWLPPALADSWRRAGVLTLGELKRLIDRGGRWWGSVPGVGPIKARRLSQHVRATLGATPASEGWKLATVPTRLAELSGARGANRALSAGHAGTDARDDGQAVRAWISARAGSPLTAVRYQREAERFILWCVMERGKAMSDATAEDCRAYMDFLQHVPETWISRRRVDRMQPGWAPFKGQLSTASRTVAIAALHSLFEWLTHAGYLVGNPWVLVNRKLGDAPGSSAGIIVGDVTSRAFTPAAWRVLREYLDAAPGTSDTAMASSDRLRWLLTFVECTGLRSAELLRATRLHLVEHGAGWVLQVHGKGRKNRSVPVPTVAVKATRAYFETRGLDFDAVPGSMPLLAALDDPEKPISYRALHETFTRFVRRAMRWGSLPVAEKLRAEKASAHWLRHTHATRAAERDVPPDVLQENLGQADPRTTARYYRAQIERRQDELERAFSEAVAGGATRVSPKGTRTRRRAQGTRAQAELELPS